MKGKPTNICIILTIYLFRNATVYRIINNRDMVAHSPPCKFTKSKSGCPKDGIFKFYPYHHTTEVWYRPNKEEDDENDLLGSGKLIDPMINLNSH